MPLEGLIKPALHKKGNSMFPSHIPHFTLQSATLLRFISVSTFLFLDSQEQDSYRKVTITRRYLYPTSLTVRIEQEFQGKPQRRTLFNTFIETQCSQKWPHNHIQTLSTLYFLSPEAECWLRGDTFLIYTVSLWPNCLASVFKLLPGHW